MEAILAGQGEPAPIYRHWQERYRIEPVDALDGLENGGPDVLLLAQPRAMAPADLVALDTWVRTGGKAIILTDPQLRWHSERALGDPARPLALGLLSPLLGHWGLEMMLDDGRTEPVEVAPGLAIAASGTGRFVRASSGGEGVQCAIAASAIRADCTVGAGQAVLVADADFLYIAANDDAAGSVAARFMDDVLVRWEKE